MSPSDAENSFIRQTFGPQTIAGGLVFGPCSRDRDHVDLPDSRSISIGETLPPPLPRTSMMSAFLRTCG